MNVKAIKQCGLLFNGIADEILNEDKAVLKLTRSEMTKQKLKF